MKNNTNKNEPKNKEFLEFNFKLNITTIKRYLSYICIAAIILVTSYGLLANLLHMVNINKTYSYNFDSGTEIKQIDTVITNIESNIKNMELIDTKLTDEEYNDIKNTISNIIIKIKRLDLLNYKGIKSFNRSDLFYIVNDNNSIGDLEIIDIYRLMGDYYQNQTFTQTELINKVISSILYASEISTPLYNNYLYTVTPFTDYASVDLKIKVIISQLKSKLDLIEDVTDFIVANGVVKETTNNEESGETNE